MKKALKAKTFAFVLTVASGMGVQVQAEPLSWTELRSLPFPENYPTQESADRLHDEMLFHRATQVVGW